VIGQVLPGSARVAITGIGAKAPDRVVTNHDLAQLVETNDEWVVERTGIRERRFAADGEALSHYAIPAARTALAQAGLDAADIDLIIVCTLTPDMVFPCTAALVGDALGAKNAAAYDLSAGCTGFVYGLGQAYGMIASGMASKALVIGGDLLSKILDMHDRGTVVLFGDGCGAVVLEKVATGGFLGFELGADGSGGKDLFMPGGGSLHPASHSSVDEGLHLIHMNGREVFKFATRILVASAEHTLAKCGVTVDDIDVYIPHQANMRIIEYAVNKLGIPQDKVVINVDRYGNTSGGSIPLALADAQAAGKLRDGALVLMTGMGTGLTWGSTLIEWNGTGEGR
jgi:3-oxoacyl-[acyl-carrier-protein] synthase-3